MADFMNFSDSMYYTSESDCSQMESSCIPKKQRKSWSTSKALQFEIAVEKVTEYENQENDVEHLELNSFSPQPKIDFGQVRVGKTVTRILIVHNPFDYEQQVVVEKFPTKKNFSVDLVEFTVEPDDTIHLTITWQPKDVMRCRELVIFNVDNTYRLQAILLGGAEKPPKPKKNGFSMRGKRCKGPKPSNVGARGMERVLQEKSAVCDSQENRRNSNTLGKHTIKKGTYFRNTDQYTIDPFLDPEQLDPETRLDPYTDDYLNNLMAQKMNADKILIEEVESLLPDTPIRRTTFNKEDPDLPPTPVRRETFIKRDPVFQHNTDDRCLTDVNIGMAVKKLLSSPLNASVNVPSTPGLMRRSLTYTKLNEVDDFSLLMEDDQNGMSNECKTTEQEDVGSISPASSQYFTPLTTPLETPHGSDSEEDDMYQDSVMYLPGEVPVTPDPNNVTVIEASMHQSWMDEDLVETPTNTKSNKRTGGSAEKYCDMSEENVQRNHTAAIGWEASHTTVTVSQNEEDDDDSQNDDLLTHQIQEARGLSWLQQKCGSVVIPSQPVVSSEAKVTMIEVKSSLENWSVTESKSETISGCSFLEHQNTSDLHHRLSSTPISICQQRKPSNNDCLWSTMGSPDKVQSPIFDGRINSNTVVKSKSDLMNTSHALDVGKQPDGVQHRRNLTHQCHRTDSKPKQSKCQLFAWDQKSPQVSSENIVSEDPVLSLDHQQMASGSQQNIRRFSPGHIGVPLLLKQRMSSLTKKRPLSLDRQTALAHLSAPTESSKKRAKCSTDVVKPTLTSAHRNKPSTNNKNLTRTEQLRREASMKSMKSYEQKKAEKPRKSVRPRTVKGIAQSRLVLVPKKQTVLPKHPLPFASKNVYYDERWMEKQEKGFVLWLNFILTPPEEFNNSANVRYKVDAGKVCLDRAVSEKALKLAPTKEVLSFKLYSAKSRMNRLRYSACVLYQSDALVTVIKKLEREIELGHIMIRRDKKMHADLGLKQKLLDMLLCYNPLWLRVGLETVYGEAIPMHSNRDLITLSGFIVTRLLGNPDIDERYAHPTVPHLYKAGYEEAMAQFILKKFLLLVLFLDKAKCSRLIEHDPCLFCKNAEYKASRELLLAFSRDFLTSEGDLTKHLSYLGYKVSHKQTYLEEFDFSVSNLATDLRCGLRLVRVMEILTHDWTLSQQLRVPAISKLQKIHNVNLALKTLKDRGINISSASGDQIQAKDIVDAHREKTLHLLWLIIFGFQIEVLINEEQLKKEIDLLMKNLKYKRDLRRLLQEVEKCSTPDRRVSMDPDMYQRSHNLSLLLKWCRAVCAHYGIKIENFTVSFCDGRALCCLLHHYHPSLLPLDKVKMDTTLTYHDSRDNDVSDWMTMQGQYMQNPGIFEELLANEKENFKLLHEALKELGGIPAMIKSADMSNTIPDERVVITFVTYLCARLLDLNEEVHAARIIQTAWREYRIKKQDLVTEMLYRHQQKSVNEAVIKIQAIWRGRATRRQIQSSNQAAVKIQQHYKAWRIGQIQRREFLLQKQAAIKLQRFVRSHLLSCRMSDMAVKRSHMNTKATQIGAWYRMVRQKRKYQQFREAVCVIQRWYRAQVLARNQRQQFLTLRKATIIIQRAFRHTLAAKQHRVKAAAAAVFIQTVYRRWQARHMYLAMRWAAVTIQRRYRAKMTARKQLLLYHIHRGAAITIQSWVRRFLAQRRLLHMHAAALVIQTAVRRHLARRQFVSQCQAAVTIQRWWRSVKTVQVTRSEFLNIRRKVIKLQAIIRMHQVRQRFLNLKRAVQIIQTSYCRYRANRDLIRQYSAALIIQHWYCTTKQGRQIRREFIKMRSAAILIQRAFREHHMRICMQQMNAATTIQKTWKAYQQRVRYQHERRSVVVIQRNVRKYQAKKKYKVLKLAALKIQMRWRAVLATRAARKQYLVKVDAAIKLQSAFRGWRARGRYREMLFEAKLSRMHSAASMIQKYYTAYIMMKHEQKKYKLLRQAAICLQAAWRCHQERKHYVNLRHAAVVIQSHVRKHQQCKRYNNLRCAAVVIQSHVRKHQQRKRYMNMQCAAIVIQSQVRKHQQRKRYMNLRHAVITIQSHVRKHQQCKRYMNLRHAAITIQSHVRRHQQCKRYGMMHQAAVVIQKRWRATVAAHHQQHQYMVTVKACIRVQAAIRGWLQVRRHTATKQAIICIQKAYRCHLRRRNQKMISDAATLIQRNVRKYQAKKKYEVLKLAALKIQMRWRAVLATRAARKQYLVKVDAAIKLQSAFRGWRARGRYREMLFEAKLSRMVSAASLIQKTYRCHLERRRQEMINDAATKIQRCYRSYCVMKKYRSGYRELKAACITIQSYIRMIQAQKRLRAHRAARLIQAVLVIQRRYRALLLMRQERLNYHIMLGAAITIQAVYKGYRQRQMYRKMKKGFTCLQALVRCRQQRDAYVKLRASVIFCQRQLRARRRHEQETQARLALHQLLTTANQQIDAVITIQRWLRARIQRQRYLRVIKSTVYLQRLGRTLLAEQQVAAVILQMAEHEKKRNAAAITIQSHWRGYKVRCSTKDKQINRARRRVKQATDNATEDKKLCNRTQSALYCLLQYKQLSMVLEAVMNLDLATRLSSRCCECLVEENAQHVLYQLIRSCNRSLPHMEIITYCVNIFLNLAKYDKTRAAVYDVEDSIQTLVDLVSIYREKGAIFTKTCILLGLLCNDPTRRKEILSMKKVVGKLESIHALTIRKYKMKESRAVMERKMSERKHLSRQASYSLYPAWCARRDSLCEISDPLQAITYVMNNLYQENKRDV